jgi:hypothetical protein
MALARDAGAAAAAQEFEIGHDRLMSAAQHDRAPGQIGMAGGLGEQTPIRRHELRAGPD